MALKAISGGEIREDLNYIGGVCQARDIESRYLFQLAQRK